MLSETLREGLKSYGIGPRIRALRLKKSMGLVELGQHSGLSPALLSKIERGRLYPTLPTLLRIALVFSVGLDHFFGGAGKPAAAVVRRADRLRLPDVPDDDPTFMFESLDFPVPERRLSGYLAEFIVGGPKKLRYHTHEGGELIYLLQGALDVVVGDDEYHLKAGDSMYLDATQPHGYRCRGKAAARALVVVSP